MLRRIEEELRSTGNLDDSNHADVINKILKQRGKDIPVTGYGSSEKKVYVSRFNPETLEKLEQAGFFVYTLTGSSISELMEAGKPIIDSAKNSSEKFGWDYSRESFFEDVSKAVEVAVKPNTFLLPGSNAWPWWDWPKRISHFSEQINLKTGAFAVMGRVNQYAELAILHLEKTGEKLFDQNQHIITSTPADDAGSMRNNFATVGPFDESGNLYIRSENRDPLGRSFAIAALVTPIPNI
ncbi:MAG TPA: hypothetical protein VF185_02135 [Patescibacteria group bacterium]